MDKVRLGTIGSGVIAHSVLDAVKVTDGVELVAVYSRTSEKAEEMANEYGAAFTYTDLQEFFNSPEINTVYIASPNNLHYIQAKAALLAMQANVNPNTMQRALARLEELGLLVTARTAGRSVTEDSRVLREMRRMLAEKKAEDYMEGMKKLGFSHEEAAAYAAKFGKEEKE